jgi:hypothetical protein
MRPGPQTIDVLIGLKLGESVPTAMVRTKYHGPTDRSGARVSATHIATRRRVTLAWDHALGAPENHERAARHLLYADPEDDREDYSRTRLLACAESGGGYVFAVVTRSMLQ